MAFKTYKFRGPIEMDLFLNGGLICGNNKAAAGIEGLVGLTLTFTQPAGVVTFAAVPGRDNPDKLLIGDIKAQIEAAIPALTVLNLNGAIAFSNPGSYVGFGAALEQSRVLLGLPKDGAIQGTVISHLNTVTPYLFWISTWDGYWAVTIWE